MSADAPDVPTRARQAAMSPEAALRELREGNRRFVAGTLLDRPWALQVEVTSDGQYPFAAVLGCIDSRVPVETVFDQGIGDVFTTRVAGNVVNPDVLGSLEFASGIAGAKAVVVLGHTSCGAVQAAIGSVAGTDPPFEGDPRWSNLAGLIRKLRPAIEATRADTDPSDPRFADRVAEVHVGLVAESIRRASPILAERESSSQLILTGAMYDVRSGEVRFF